MAKSNVAVFTNPTSVWGAAEILNVDGGQSLRVSHGLPWYRTSDYANLGALWAAAGAGPYNIIVNADVAVTANLALGAGIHLVYQPGCEITVSNGVTWTLASPEHVHCPIRQRAFVLAGTGLVAFTGGGTVHPGWWGAVFDGGVDDTAALRSAVDACHPTGIVAMVQGVCRITATITVDGALGSVRIVGVQGQRIVLPGGAVLDSVSAIEWDGAAGGLMFSVNSANGVKFEHVNIRTKVAIEGTIAIDNVTGVQFINRSTTRFSRFIDCEFTHLGVGIHYYDDAGDPASDTNMDGHAIRDCTFRCCRTSIKVENVSVYDTVLDRVSFYGSETYTKHHIHIVSGRVYGHSLYLGRLKNAGSPGGQDGVALLCVAGQFALVNCYDECLNGPKVQWTAAQPAQAQSVLINCYFATDSGGATTWNVLNETNSVLAIIGGYIAGNVKQAVATTGVISCLGVFSVAVDATGLPDRVERFGGLGSGGQLGLIGTAGVGKATIRGTAPVLRMYDVDDSVYAEQTFNSAGNRTLETSVNGVRSGWVQEFATGLVKFSANNWVVEGAADQRGDVTLNTVAATTVVANTRLTANHRVFLFPRSAAAATLMSGPACPYISAIAVGVSFTITTADGSNAPAGCLFAWLIM